MSPGLADYLAIGLLAAAVTAIATPLVARQARRRSWVVEPNARSVHTSPIPHVGGLAMLLGFLVAFVVAWTTNGFDPIFHDNSEPEGVLIAILIVFVTGFLDDIMDLAPPGKVTGVVLAGIALSYFGVTMFNFRVPFLDVVILSGDWQAVVTVVWLLVMTQAINLIDGLDGLAAGIVAIGSGAFFLYANKLGDLELLQGEDRNLGPLVAVITVGVCIGFLPYNFNPARIFMGDSGAFLLGAMLAISTSVVGGRADPNTQDHLGATFFFFAPLAIPLLILGVPILDTTFAILRRLSKRQPFDVADKGHLHHRLMNLGHGHRRSVLILWAWTALLSGFVLYPVLAEKNPTYVTFGIAALGIVLFTVLHPSVRRKRAEAVEAALDRPASEQVDPSRPERREAEHLAERWSTEHIADDELQVPSAPAASTEGDRDPPGPSERNVVADSSQELLGGEHTE